MAEGHQEIGMENPEALKSGAQLEFGVDLADGKAVLQKQMELTRIANQSKNTEDYEKVNRLNEYFDRYQELAQKQAA